MATRTRQKTTSAGRSSGQADPVTAYARGVADGEIIAGPHVRNACARHLRDLVEGPKRGLLWNPVLPLGAPKGKGHRPVQRAIGFFRDVLRLNGGKFEGKPFILAPSQVFVVGSLFGWIRQDGFRRFRTVYDERGKGNGKSPIAGGIGHYAMAADGEERAEVYSVATDKDQASILFRDAVAMARQSPALGSRITFSGGVGHEFNMLFTETHSFFRPISSDSVGRGKSGYRPHCGLVDEFHEHPTNAMVEFLVANVKSREQPIIFIITNSGHSRTSPCFEYHEYARKVAAGEIEDDEFLAYLCAHDEDEDPFTDEPDPVLGYPRSWAKTNPLLGVTIQPSYLEKQVREAQGMPSKEAIVRRLNFCEWGDGAVTPWIEGDLWRACEEDDVEHEGATYLALDLSGTRDLTAAARASVDSEGMVTAEIKAWTPADTLEKRALEDRVPYDVWVESGDLIAVPGRSIGKDFVATDLGDWLANATACAYDPYLIDDFLRALDNAGIEAFVKRKEDDTGPGIPLIPHGQGFAGGTNPALLWMPRSINDLEQLILEGRLRVKRNPLLTFANASAVLTSDAAGNRKWEKRKSTGRIDPLVALCMVVGLALSELAAPDEGPQILVLGGSESAPDANAPQRWDESWEEPWW